MTNPSTTGSPPSRAVKWTLRLFHLLYVCLLPFAIYMTLLSSMVADGPSETPLTITITMLTVSLLPLSMWLAMRFMWSAYGKNQPHQALVFAGLPFYTCIAIPIILCLLDWFAHGRLPW